MIFFKRKKPKIAQHTRRREGFNGWIKCTSCKELIHTYELAINLQCCPRCDHHYSMSASDRIEHICDHNSFEEIHSDLCSNDPLQFVDQKSYVERLQEAQTKTNLNDALVIGKGSLAGTGAILACMDFRFMGGSMGSVVGEKFTLAVEHAIDLSLPLITFCSSGGARMQEGVFSLMQMAKTSSALARLKQGRMPYISVLTNPTTGGVTASFASLGDVIIAEPAALICFAGPRVIEQTIRQKLPPGAQKSEFLLEHGMIDAIVPRHQLKSQLSKLLSLMLPKTQ